MMLGYSIIEDYMSYEPRKTYQNLQRIPFQVVEQQC